MALKKKPSVSQKISAWLAAHNGLACVGICAGSGVAIAGILAFIVFSGFGSSADFIYNQF